MSTFYIEDTSDEESQANSSKAKFRLQWRPKEYSGAFVPLFLSLLTVGSVYVLSIAYYDTLTGPTYLLSFLAYAPFIYSCMRFRDSLFQIYIASLLTIVSIWLIIPYNVGLAAVYGLPFGFGFWFLTCISLHVWLKARTGAVDLGFVARLVCLHMLTAYVVANTYGILVSIGIQFYRVPFFLQPIAVFSFAALEGLVILVNCLAAWIGFEISSKGIKSVMRWRKNPIVYLVGVLALWISLAGIILASQKSLTTVKVSTMGLKDFSYFKTVLNKFTPPEVFAHFLSQPQQQPGAIEQTAREIRQKILSSGSKFVVIPEFQIFGNFVSDESCHDIVRDAIAPQVAGLGAYVVIGCLQNSVYPLSGSSNLALTIAPDGSILRTYWKTHTIPGENSFSKSKYLFHQFSPVSGPGFKFNTLISTDIDHIDSVAKSADMGSSLILNPSDDWREVRHHFASSIIRAVENRVAIVKADKMNDAAIVDPFGNLAAFGGGNSPTSLTAEIPISEPLQPNFLRQHLGYWIFIAGYAVLTGYDLYTLWKRRS